MLPVEIVKGVYLVGRAGARDRKGCHVYLLDFGELVLVDAGTGRSFDRIVDNIASLGFNPQDISSLILTHCHVDHTAGAWRFRERFGCRLLMHEADSAVIEEGDNELSAGSWFKVFLPPTPVDLKLKGELNILRFGNHELFCLHTPGHSPGSLSLYTDMAGKRVLFGQDIHAPIVEGYRCDPQARRESLEKLLALKADILCEGHKGIFQPAERVNSFIEGYLHGVADC